MEGDGGSEAVAAEGVTGGEVLGGGEEEGAEGAEGGGGRGQVGGGGPLAAMRWNSTCYSRFYNLLAPQSQGIGFSCMDKNGNV